MYLMVYLKLKNLNAETFAKLLNVSKNSVLGWANGKTLPNVINTYSIEQTTKGLVTYNDLTEFYRMVNEDSIRKQSKRALGDKSKESSSAKTSI